MHNDSYIGREKTAVKVVFSLLVLDLSIQNVLVMHCIELNFLINFRRG